MNALSPRVLIVDDDAVLLDALSQMLRLRFEAIEVQICQSAGEAFERISLSEYDCIISDIKMPGIDGLELLKRIQDVSPDVPVLLITGHGETDLAIQALRARACDLVQKPIDRDYFIASLTRALELTRLRREVKAKQEALERYAEELEQRVLERTAELTTANRAKDEFLGLISHEMKTPLTVIIGNAAVLQTRSDRISEEDKASLVFGMREEGRRLQRIIDNLLVLGKAELGVRPRAEPVNLTKLIEAQVESHRQTYPGRRINILCPAELIVESEPTNLEIVLGNLISNAEKYGGPEEPIEIIGEVQDGEIVVSVLDRGQGFAQTDAELLFQPFFRADDVVETVSGVGIGLTVCKRLIESQGGAISAAAREGGGSNFYFRLPAPTFASDYQATGAEKDVSGNGGWAASASIAG